MLLLWLALLPNDDGSPTNDLLDAFEGDTGYKIWMKERGILAFNYIMDFIQCLYADKTMKTCKATYTVWSSGAWVVVVVTHIQRRHIVMIRVDTEHLLQSYQIVMVSVGEQRQRTI